MTVTRCRRRRRRGYHTGVHESSKSSGPCKYRSGWEASLMSWFDAEPSVLRYAYEAVAIPYVSNARSGRVRRYFPDFVVEFTDGRRVMVEVKPSKRVSQPNVQKKLAAARTWCLEHGVTLQVITELDLRAMGLV